MHHLLALPTPVFGGIVPLRPQYLRSSNMKEHASMPRWAYATRHCFHIQYTTELLIIHLFFLFLIRIFALVMMLARQAAATKSEVSDMRHIRVRGQNLTPPRMSGTISYVFNVSFFLPLSSHCAKQRAYFLTVISGAQHYLRAPTTAHPIRSEGTYTQRFSICE